MEYDILAPWMESVTIFRHVAQRTFLMFRQMLLFLRVVRQQTVQTLAPWSGRLPNPSIYRFRARSSAKLEPWIGTST